MTFSLSSAITVYTAPPISYCSILCFILKYPYSDVNPDFTPRPYCFEYYVLFPSRFLLVQKDFNYSVFFIFSNSKPKKSSYPSLSFAKSVSCRANNSSYPASISCTFVYPTANLFFQLVSIQRPPLFIARKISLFTYPIVFDVFASSFYKISQNFFSTTYQSFFDGRLTKIPGLLPPPNNPYDYPLFTRNFFLNFHSIFIFPYKKGKSDTLRLPFFNPIQLYHSSGEKAFTVSRKRLCFMKFPLRNFLSHFRFVFLKQSLSFEYKP